MAALTRRWAYALLSGVTALPLACQRPLQPKEPTAARIAADDLDQAWDAALGVLRQHDFHPDRQDRAQGIINTFPATSMQWGEIWRRDVADSYGYSESSLHTTQRRATVRFIRGTPWTIEVQVDVYRLNMPDSQITTASSAIQAFSGVLPSAEGTMQFSADARRNWVHLGRDAAMESRLLDGIVAAL